MKLIFIQNLLYLLTGVLTGTLSGILGIGGGIIVVPALLMIFEMNAELPRLMDMHIAAGSSLAVILLTSIAAVRAHSHVESIQWWVYQRIWKGIAIGTIIGAYLATQLPTDFLRKLFACFLLFVAYKMLAQAKKITTSGTFPQSWIHQCVTLFIGLNSGLLGVGGGILIVPYLTYCGLSPVRIPPISSLCTLTVALIGTFTFMLATPPHLGYSAYATGYIYWPAVLWVGGASMLCAPLGAKLSYQLPIPFIRKLFILILLVTATGLFL